MEHIYHQLTFTIVNVMLFFFIGRVYPNVQTTPARITMEMPSSQGCIITSSESKTGFESVMVERNTTNQTCSFVISSDTGIITGVQMLQGYVKGTDFLYVERTENQDDDRSIYYVVLLDVNQDGNQPCCVTFTDKHLAFHLHGSIRLHLQSPTQNQSVEICPPIQLRENITSSENLTTCKGIEEYPSLIQCYYRNQPTLKESFWDYDTRCDIGCQEDCHCALDNRQVKYLCSNQESPNAAFITYPSNVTNLNFSHNNLSSITAMAFHSIGGALEKLDFGFNHLVNINSAFSILTNLKVLYLDNNKLENLGQTTFDNLGELRVLDLSENWLTVLEEGIFHGLHALSELYLPDNRLTNIQERTFAALGKLNKLHLQRNDFLELKESTFYGLHNLTELNLMDARLYDIPSGLFRDLANLQLLHLEHNYLRSLEADVFNRLGTLHVLEMNHNTLTSLKDGIFQSLNYLRALVLAKNELQTLRAGWFIGLNQLEELELWGNQIAMLETEVFQNLRSLNGLHLQGNSLETLEMTTFKGLKKLTKLDVFKNRLVVVQPGVLDDMLELKILTLARNRLSSLPSNLFRYSTNLKYLDLSKNQLIDLPFVGHLSQLQHLIIKENMLTKIQANRFHQFSERVKVIVSQPEVCICFLNNSENCKAKDQQSPYLTCKKMLPDMVLVIFMWVGGFGALFGNAFVLFWRKTQPQEEYQVQKILIGNLALADLFMGMYMVIIASADIHYGDYFPMNAQIWRSGAVCRIAGALAITSSEASIMMLTVISIDRVIHIKYQINKWKPRVKSTMMTALAVWLFALVIASAASFQAEGNSDIYEASNVCVGLPLAMKKVHALTPINFSKNSYSLHSESYYEYWNTDLEDISTFDEHAPGMYLSVTVFLGLNLLCCVIIVGCYVVIVTTVFRSVGQVRRQRHMRHEIRMTTKVVAIVATDLCCWCPIILTSILVQAGVVKISPRIFVWIVTFILPINSVINPYLYTLGNVIAERLPKPTDRPTSSRTTCTNADRCSRPEPTCTANHPSQYVIEESEYTAPLVKQPYVVMETCV